MATDPATWWHVYPLGAVGAPIREPDDDPARDRHRLLRLLPWLDHAAALGATGIQLGPIFSSRTHGYDTLDHARIDPRLGDEADFDRLVRAAHERGLRVLLDGVFNHVSADHPLHCDALAAGPGSDAARRFRIDWSDPARPRSACFEGHEDLVLLDHARPEVETLVGDTMLRWLDAGADGWRLDAAYAVDPGFWARVLPRVRAAHPHATFVGEVIHGDYAGYVERSGLDAVTQYELWKAAWSAIADRNPWELAWALERHTAFLARFRPHTFIGNHDVTRIASRVGEAGAQVALAVLLTVGGDVSLYAGDEWGALGTKEPRLGGDDAVRPALPASPADIDPAGRPMLELHRRLIGLRRRHPWLADAPTRIVTKGERVLVYETGGGAGDGAVARVAIDLAGVPRARVGVGGEEVTAGG